MFEVRLYNGHSEILRDGRLYLILSWDRDGSRAEALIALWATCGEMVAF